MFFLITIYHFRNLFKPVQISLILEHLVSKRGLANVACRGNDTYLYYMLKLFALFRLLVNVFNIKFLTMKNVQVVNIYKSYKVYLNCKIHIISSLPNFEHIGF